jgi:glycosyltransferase involved in cell wall biosynthesis
MGSVSVIIPNYNREALIGETIRNLLLQTLPPGEIVVVDDGSTDNSVEVIRSFGTKVKLIQQFNQGPGAARNAGLKVAVGDYIQFQDSDDLLSLNKLQAQARQLDETGADIVLGPWAHVFIRDRRITFESCVLQQALPLPHLKLSAWMLRGWATIFQSLLFRRDFLAASGLYQTQIRYGEDMEFFFRMLCRSPRVAFAGDVLTLYRVDAPNKLSHDGGRSKSRRDLDWAACLHFMNQQSQVLEPRVDRLTRVIFQVAIRKHLRHTAVIPEEFARLARELKTETEKAPRALLGFVELCLRLGERIRLARTGYRWMPGYEASPATSQQMKLIENLGFEFSQQSS